MYKKLSSGLTPDFRHSAEFSCVEAIRLGLLASAIFILAACGSESADSDESPNLTQVESADSDEFPNLTQFIEIFNQFSSSVSEQSGLDVRVSRELIDSASSVDLSDIGILEQTVWSETAYEKKLPNGNLLSWMNVNYREQELGSGASIKFFEIAFWSTSPNISRDDANAFLQAVHSTAAAVGQSIDGLENLGPYVQAAEAAMSGSNPAYHKDVAFWCLERDIFVKCVVSPKNDLEMAQRSLNKIYELSRG